MMIAVLGAGRLGGRLARAWRKAGHDVMVGVRDTTVPDVQALVRESGVAAGPVEQAARAGEVIVLAVPHAALDTLLPAVAISVSGKVVIDCTNALSPDRSLKFPLSTSAAEETARRLPGALVVKSFNSQGAETLADPVYGGLAASGFFCGDDAGAKRIVADLIADVGLEPVDVGPLRQARWLEALTLLWLSAAATGGSRDIAFRLLRR